MVFIRNNKDNIESLPIVPNKTGKRKRRGDKPVPAVPPERACADLEILILDAEILETNEPNYN